MKYISKTVRFIFAASDDLDSAMVSNAAVVSSIPSSKDVEVTQVHTKHTPLVTEIGTQTTDPFTAKPKVIH